MATVEWIGYERLQARLGSLIQITHDMVRPLMERWEDIIFEDNRRGVLAGMDKDDRKLAPVKARTGRYKNAVGPPLAPFGVRSRSIKNLATDHFQDNQGRWTAIGAWEDVVSDNGTPFLPFHFRGEGRLPVRDLTGVRQQGMDEAETALAEWADEIVGNM